MCVGVLSVGLGPGLDSMSPARSRRSASHAAGTHGRLPQKTGRPGLRRGGVGGYNLHSVPPNSPPDCGTPTTSRLYPFGAQAICLPHCHTHIYSLILESLACKSLSVVTGAKVSWIPSVPEVGVSKSIRLGVTGGSTDAVVGDGIG